MNLKRFLPFIFLFVMITAIGTSFAQLPSADRYGSPFALDEKGIPYSSKYWQGQPGTNVISLLRKPELGQGQFVLRITQPYIMSGCVDISNYGYRAEYKDIYLDIEVGPQTVDLRDQPQYSHYQCDKSAKQPSADVVLNKADIILNKTQQIRMHNGTDTNYYNIEINEQMIRILPDAGDVSVTKRFKPQNIPGRKTALTHWFYPKGTMLMWVPGTKDNPSLKQKLKAFARIKGLEPLENVYPGFESPLTNTHYHYFVDKLGRFTDEDEELMDGKIIGTIAIEKLVYGLEKDELELDEVVVYAKRPGMYE